MGIGVFFTPCPFYYWVYLHSIVLFINLDGLMNGYIGLGYFMHIIMDSFSVSGVPLFKPFYDESIKLGLGKIYYRTGSLFEKSVFFITAGFVFILILKFNLIELFTEDIARWLSLIWQNVKDWRLFLW